MHSDARRLVIARIWAGRPVIAVASYAARSAVAAALMVTLHSPAGAQAIDSLHPTEIDSIAHRVTVMRQTRVDGTPWPRVRLFRFVDATPEQSAAMLADYEHQAAYIKDLKEAKIVRRVDPTRTEMFFRYSAGLPLLPTTTYTVSNRLERLADGSYVITWSLVSGARLKSIDGRARFAAWRNPMTGRDGTLLIYDQFVVPDFSGAGLSYVRNRGLNGMRDAVDSIGVEIERERTGDNALLNRQLMALRAALGS